MSGDQLGRAVRKLQQDAHNLALQEQEISAQLKDRRISSDESFRLLRKLDAVRTKRMQAEEAYKALAERSAATPLAESEMPPIFLQCHLHSKGNTLIAAAVQWIDKEQTQLAALCPHCIEEGRKLVEEEKKKLAAAPALDQAPPAP